jgi:hypothetical protein
LEIRTSRIGICAVNRPAGGVNFKTRIRYDIRDCRYTPDAMSGTGTETRRGVNIADLVGGRPLCRGQAVGIPSRCVLVIDIACFLKRCRVSWIEVGVDTSDFELLGGTGEAAADRGSPRPVLDTVIGDDGNGG